MRLTDCSPGVLSEAVHDKVMLIIIGSCLTIYEGRGAAHSDYGDKLIIVKRDGSVIVHGPRGFKPLNWQPDTVHISFLEEGGELVMRAVRGKPRETLVVKCRETFGCVTHAAREGGGFYMYFSEAEVRDILRDNPELIEEGLRITDVEKPIQPGFIDLYGIDIEGRTTVFEIKRVKAGEEAARQLYGYVERLKRSVPNIRGVLLAPDFTESALAFLQKAGLEAKQINLKKLYEMYSERVKRRTGIKHRSLLDYLGQD
ncbi:MAG: endonuclease NucS [Desulfurococcales archaeon]|nr:endonuclease NucS [Desulfurococcales archaeon]